jgi:hypothetical protein
LEDDLEVNDIISNAHKKETFEEKIAYLSLGLDKYPENASIYGWRGFFFNSLEKHKEKPNICRIKLRNHLSFNKSNFPINLLPIQSFSIFV